MGPYLPSCEVSFGVSEDVALQTTVRTRSLRSSRFLATYCEKVDKAHGVGDNARGNHKAPKWQPKAFLACRLFVQISQHTVSQEDHGDPEHDKASSRAEKRPSFRDVGFEDGKFGEDQES